MDTAKQKTLGKNCQQLVCAVIEQAVLDWRELRRVGVIVNGKLNPEWIETMHGYFNEGAQKLKRIVVGYSTKRDVEELIRFFAQGGHMEYLLRIGGVNVAAAAIRRAL